MPNYAFNPNRTQASRQRHNDPIPRQEILSRSSHNGNVNKGCLEVASFPRLCSIRQSQGSLPGNFNKFHQSVIIYCTQCLADLLIQQHSGYNVYRVSKHYCGNTQRFGVD